MKIRLHIERLVLDGLPLERRQAPQVQAALERELSRLLSAEGRGRDWRTDGAVARLKAPAIRLTKGNPPQAIGRDIAKSIHAALGARR